MTTSRTLHPAPCPGCDDPTCRGHWASSYPKQPQTENEVRLAAELLVALNRSRDLERRLSEMTATAEAYEQRASQLAWDNAIEAAAKVIAELSAGGFVNGIHAEKAVRALKGSR